jgi:hypothetical protein
MWIRMKMRLGPTAAACLLAAAALGLCLLLALAMTY